jgi:hypothetical protein
VLVTREVSESEIFAAQRLGWAARRAGSDYLWARPLGDGRAVFLLEMLGGNLRLAIGDQGSPFFDDVWCYQSDRTDEAWRAALGWDGEGEPEYWYRHPDTGRRRPGGDPAREVVYA